VIPSCDNPTQALHIVLGAMSLEQRAVAPQLDAAALVAEKGRLAVMQVRPRWRTRLACAFAFAACAAVTRSHGH
jgi:hypothetical protein